MLVGGGGCFFAITGRKVGGAVVAVVLGACFDAARAYDGVGVFLDWGTLKVKPLLGLEKVALSSLRPASILSRCFSKTSGILHPNVFAPVSVCSTWLSSSSPGNRFCLIDGMFTDCSTNSRTVAARVLMSAAVSEPKDEICSPPFFGRRIDPSISS